MRPFQLHRPGTLDEVLTLLEEHGPDETHVLAGGTSLVLLMNLGLVQPGHVVSLREVAELHGTQRLPDGGIVLRAMATHRQLEQSVDVAAFCPALTETFGHVATVRIRNQATVGGNVVHADPAQDPPAMLVALDAEAVIRSRAGQRIIPLESLFVGYLTTSLTDGEVLTEIRLPPLAAGTRAAYEKFLPRTQDDYATVSVAATVRLAGDGTCNDVRIVLGGVAAVPLRVRAVEDALRGAVLTDARIAEAAALVNDLVDPPDDSRGSAAYKRRMARVWTERVLRRLRNPAESDGVHHP